MELDEIIRVLREESGLIDDKYFDLVAYRYLSGRFPELTIKQCTDAIDRLCVEIGFWG